MDDLPTEGTGIDGWSNRAFFAVLGAIVAMIVAAFVVVVVTAGAGGSDARHSAPSSASHGAVAPLELSTVPDQLAGHYRHAQAHMAEYAQVPCWCGCQQFLGHRNLADCFVRADGQGFEAHAAGCGVCTAEAVIAEQMLGQGHTPADVKAAVDAQFGTTAITTPTTNT